ncbi:YqaA family protein [Cycloclasticus pugetii]|uniref:YqaA family protein n=1 Tax=Cycloclasticus pugetii TaxID=34068 RepID=UPI00091546F8|nr:YqaA family protein [Cycloclasticus pugetii]SHJ35628.1 membrane protein YqaA, SNARE-associated domain [Cycloclasticus pugetii]
MFKRLYQQVLFWAEHPKANRYLFTLSFAESSFFPIPPDVMLAPMCLAKPSKSFYFAMITTIGSVVGGVFGYLIGMFSFELIEPIIEMFHYREKLEHVNAWFIDWGFWAILIAGFSPIPYKLFTIAAGLLGMMFIPFVLASIVGRGARFFLVAFLVSLGGNSLKNKLNDYIEVTGWIVTAMIVMGLLISRFY